MPIWEASTATAERLVDQIYALLTRLVDQYHARDSRQSFMLTFEPPYYVQQTAGPGNKRQKRCLVASPYWAMTVHSSGKILQVFLLPLVELLTAQTESATRLRLSLDTAKHKHECVGSINNVKVSSQEFESLIFAAFNDLLRRSQSDHLQVGETAKVTLGNYSVTGLVQNLLGEKQRLIDSLVGEHERTKRRIASDIHDGPLADLAVLQRELEAGEKAGLSAVEKCELAKNISASLRTLCAELYPRDIEEWGLALMLKGLVSRFNKRNSGCCQLTIPDELPKMPDEVLLHAYRIVQEALHNCEKHARARHVHVEILEEEATLIFRITDDGIGIDLASPKEGAGFGMSMMKERTDLISRLNDASLAVSGSPGNGTVIKLSIAKKNH